MLQWVYWQAHWVWAYQLQKQEYTPEDRAFLTYKVCVMLFNVPVCNGNNILVACLRRCTCPVPLGSTSAGCTADGMHATLQQPKCQCRP